MEEEYTVEDIKDVYEASLKFPTDSFGSADFWKGLILAKAVGPHIRTLGSERVAALWRQIMKKTDNKAHMFKSMLADYFYAKDRNTELTQKIENTLLDLFVRDAQLTLPDPQSIKMSGKRQSAEDVHSHSLTPRKRFKVTTESRFPSLDLRLLIDEDLILAQRYDEQDKYDFANTFNREGFSKCYNEILNAHEENRIIGCISKKEANKKLFILRRALQMFQQCYGKSSQEISEIYAGSSGDLKVMHEYLKGKGDIVLWNDEEDEILRNGVNSAEYESLVKKRGKKEVEKRAKYLEIFAQP
jgi:hypothetical protein